MIDEHIVNQFYNDVEELKLKFPVASISQKTGFSKGNVSQYLSKKLVPSEGFIKKFYECFKISRRQQANMLEEPAAEYGFQQKLLNTKNGKDKKRIPLYDTEATATDTLTEMTPIQAPAGTIDIGDLLNDSQAAIRIYGNSMLPNYPPGCVVGLVQCSDAYIEPGEVYVIETRDRRLLKRLFYKEDDTSSDLFTCYSDNIMKFEGGARNGKLAYPPFDLPKQEIQKIFMVTGVIKRNSNSIIINKY